MTVPFRPTPAQQRLLARLALGYSLVDDDYKSHKTPGKPSPVEKSLSILADHGLVDWTEGVSEAVITEAGRRAIPTPPKPPRTMPEQAPGDGDVAVRRNLKADTVTAIVTTNGVTESITMSEHNAWRVFGSLSIMLDLPVTPAVAKAIRF